MNVKNPMFVAIGLLLAGLLMSPAARAQVSRERRDAIRARMEQLKKFFSNMPDEHKRALSGSAQNLMHVAENRMDELMRGETPRPERLGGKSSTQGLSGVASGHDSKQIQVSDPSTDFAFSVQTGFTQSETSTAWCGNNVVVGFNDSGSLPESIFFGPGGASFNGVARSTRRGESFVDLGFLNPGPNFFDFLAGDPVLGCANGSTFYYASLFETGTPSAPLSAISASISSDGGATFGNPVVAVSKDGFTHFLDKEWMAVDPTNPNRIFVTYTDFDSTGAVCGFSSLGTPIPRAAIELVQSTDGGATWSAPLVIDETCGASFVQGSQVAVGSASEVYVARERFVGGFSGPRSLVISKSVDHGMTFGPTVKVDDVTPSGDGFALEGNFRNFLTGSLAVDRSGGPTKGFVYIGWDDGRNLQVPDFGGINFFYGYADILVRRSTDGGATWSPAVRVNDNLEPLENGRGSDQYQPGVAVDKTGRVAACFYDRRNDPSNFRIDRFCAVSEDAGATWNNKQVTEKSFSPIHAMDTFINTVYLGDYDVLASDFTKLTSGFIGAYQFINSNEVFVPNPDVKATRLP